MYCRINYQTKKALKDAVLAGKQVGVFQPNQMFPAPEAEPGYCGTATLEGPHCPQPHKWYASVVIEKGVIVKVT